MLLYLNIILTLILGLIIGLNLKRIPFVSIFSKRPVPESPNNLNYNPTFHQEYIPQNLDKLDMNHCFDTLEIRFLHKLLQEDEFGVNVKTLNTITNLTHLTDENQRQRRHLFLKELNLKLFLIFGIRESIVRLDSLVDKRVKNYILSNQIDKEKLMVSISTSDE
jgi:hypothetical protein